MSDPTPERIAAALALAEDALRYELAMRKGGAAPLRADLIDAYRATAPKPLRTRAEQNQRIAEHCRANAGCWSAVALTVMQELCREPLAPDPTETGACPPECPDVAADWTAVGDDGAFARPFGTIRVCHCGCLVAGGPTRCLRCAEPNRVTDHDADQRPHPYGPSSVDSADPPPSSVPAAGATFHTVDQLPALWESQAAAYPADLPLGCGAAAAVRLCAKELRTALAAQVAVDPLHPTGRCSCGGEGRCDWCKVPCEDCSYPRAVCTCQPEACGCEQSDDLKDKLTECRRLLRAIHGFAKSIAELSREVP